VSPQSERPRQAAEIEQWIAQARQGNRDALGRLLDTCRRYLLLVANQELHAALHPKVAPSDIVQDTLMEAGRDFPRFQGATQEELLGWLRGILRNNVANVHRHFETDKRQVALEVPLAETPLVELRDRILDPAESPSGVALARERDEQLERAMQQLPEHYRQVLLWHATDGLTFVQIAAKLGNTADAARKQWARAVEELGKRLEMFHELT
jgi:RNA polymerase sigma-70 factor (ECF subfamily)